MVILANHQKKGSREPSEHNRWIFLDEEEITLANTVAIERHTTGGKSRDLHSGFEPKRQDVVGAMAEIATCLWYDLNPHEWVKVYDERPKGSDPDLIYKGFKVSVKGTEWWNPCTLMLPEYDTANDIYILVSVDPDTGHCGMRGWIKRPDLLKRELVPWKGKSDVPGANRNVKWWYIPLNELAPCQEPTFDPREALALLDKSRGV
jgi:hypothetical protein